MARLDRFGFRIVREPMDAPVLPHIHCDIEIAWVDAPGWLMAVGRRRIRLPERCLVAHFAGYAHHLQAAPEGERAVWITIPMEDAAGVVPPRLLRRCLAGEAVPDPEPLAEDAPAVVRLAADWARGGELRRIALDWLRARLLRMDAADAARAAVPAADRTFPGRAIPAMLSTAAIPGAGVQDAAARLGYHPKYFIQAFRRACGIGARDLLTRLRVARAMEELRAHPGARLEEVARRAGFGSVSAMYRSFRAVAGVGARAWLGAAG